MPNKFKRILKRYILLIHLYIVGMCSRTKILLLSNLPMSNFQSKHWTKHKNANLSWNALSHTEKYCIILYFLYSHVSLLLGISYSWTLSTLRRHTRLRNMGSSIYVQVNEFKQLRHLLLSLILNNKFIYWSNTRLYIYIWVLILIS